MLTSPPYGASIHGQVTARPGRGVAKYDNTYSPDPGNLGRVNQPPCWTPSGTSWPAATRCCAPVGCWY